MEQLLWETAEELDRKLAQRVRNIRKRSFHFPGETIRYEWRKLWFHQTV